MNRYEEYPTPDVPRRVVSLVPSATETLLALGANVVACTRFCEQPDLPHVGGTKNPDRDGIVALAPDVVVLDEEENRREDADALAAAGLALCVTSVRSVAQALDAVAALAAAAGVVVPIGGDDTTPTTTPPVRQLAFVPIWRRPWMTINADTYGGSLLRLLGIELVTADATERYPSVELADLPRPDAVYVPSEPYAFDDGHVAELAAAFPGARVERVDGQDLFWWGIRTPAAIRRLRRRAGRRAGRRADQS